MELFVSDAVYNPVKVVLKNSRVNVYVCQKGDDTQALYTLNLIKDKSDIIFLLGCLDKINSDEYFMTDKGMCLVFPNKPELDIYKNRENSVTLALGLTLFVLTAGLPHQLLYQILNVDCVAAQNDKFYLNYYFNFHIGWLDCDESGALLELKQLITTILNEMPNHNQYSKFRIKKFLKKKHNGLLDFYIQFDQFIKNYKPILISDIIKKILSICAWLGKKLAVIIPVLAAVVLVYFIAFSGGTKDILVEKIGTFLLDKWGEIIQN